MKKFAISLLVVSSLTLATLQAGDRGKRIHHSGNPQAALFHAIETSNFADIKENLPSDATKDHLNRAIQAFSKSNENSSKVLVYIAKNVSQETAKSCRACPHPKKQSKAYYTKMKKEKLHWC